MTAHSSRFLAGGIAALLSLTTLAACGGDDDAATPQDQLVADLVDGLSVIDGIDVDEDCISAKVAELSDEQVTAMSESLEAGAEPPADLADWNASVGDECLSAG